MDVCVIDHPLAAARLTVLRDERTDTAGFRAAANGWSITHTSIWSRVYNDRAKPR
ncbi:hypothetical protein MAHJHV28_46950 [Mycobacterium avium subsp. hominissuis]